MKTICVLLINYDNTALNIYAPLLSGDGITSRPASNMMEALNMLLTDEYSGIVINADDFEYLPYLKVMRALTPVPIGVAASQYNRDEHDAAVNNGADLYRVRYDDGENRVKGFSNVVKIYLEFNNRQNGESSPIIYGDVRILPDTRRVFAQDKEVELGRVEFDVLRCLIKNKGRILTHEQIYRNVWGEDYADSPHDMLWWHISKLRKKMRTEANLPDIIKTKYGVGYSVG